MKPLLSTPLLGALITLSSCSSRSMPTVTVTGNTVHEVDRHIVSLFFETVARRADKSWTAHENTPKGVYHIGVAPASAIVFRAFDAKGGAEGLKQFEITTMTATVNGGAPILYKRLATKVLPDDLAMPGDYWVPATFNESAASAPKLPEGAYKINIHYRVANREYDAVWDLGYKTGTHAEPWRFSTS